MTTEPAEPTGDSLGLPEAGEIPGNLVQASPQLDRIECEIALV